MLTRCVRKPGRRSIIILSIFLWFLVSCRRHQEIPRVSRIPPSPTASIISVPASDPKQSAPLLVLTPVTFPTTTYLQTSVDGLPHYTIDILLNARDRFMQVEQYVVFVNHTNDVWEKVVFSVPPAHMNGVFLLQDVEIITRERTRLADTDMQNTMLHVLLPESLKPGELLGIRLTFVVRIPSIAPSTWLPEGNLGAGDLVIQAGDWHPTLVPYVEGTGWHTWEYYAVGDPTVYPAASFDVHISADPDLIIAGPGEVVQPGPVRFYQLQQARSFAFTASYDYQVIEASVDGIPVRSFYVHPYAEGGQAVMDTVQMALPFLSTLFGPYPVPDLVIAQNAYYGSMEYSGFISMSDYAYKTYQKAPADLLVNLSVHELAHQWWYSAVGNDQVYEPWLDESFAKYSELLFYERYYPDVVPWWWENHIDRYNPGGPVNTPIYSYQNTADYIHQVYSQGARFLDDLRADMGDAQFFAFVKAYQEYGQGRIVSSEDFFTVLSAYSAGDLVRIVDQYFEFE
ncbi:MAG: M1 family metallopeptidase [Anaerolineae bacterium]|nr:M1 family metallopeptidase [Anaerolineae bacterium]